MVGILGFALFALVGVAWVSAVVHVLLLLPHRDPAVSLFTIAFTGYRFLQRSTFRPSGHALHRRFLISVAVFFGALVGGMLLGMLAQ